MSLRDDKVSVALDEDRRGGRSAPVAAHLDAHIAVVDKHIVKLGGGAARGEHLLSVVAEAAQAERQEVGRVTLAVDLGQVTAGKGLSQVLSSQNGVGAG